ncbi:GntR family transcriptional regulator [Bordetella genomosp. 10]|uniref:GntR family transcriptional regulator n=1 Tax=Bordetella genomosp. 10 TaxID=1416804 RepID=A0A261RXZ4_9BORD|nr:GntR family transcriptional regulator [Bordetella genomosp. 10]OZI29795.1 GntR family transcriptional regulator [Bordetella genomosp. 10]
MKQQAVRKTPAKAATTRGRPKVRPSALVAADTAEDAETRIYRSVLGGVMGQRLLPGTKLPEAALCELFGVGRTVVQKALQRLAHDHVVELRPNRGAIVAMPTREEVDKLFEARRILETSILPLVAKSATKADFAMLRRQLREEHHAMHSAPQTEWARLASTFHLKLGEMSGNPLLARYLMEIISRCALVVAIFQPPGNATCEHDEHARVVDYLERGKVKEAIAEMDAHLRDLESHIQLVEERTERSLADMLGLG